LHVASAASRWFARRCERLRISRLLDLERRHARRHPAARWRARDPAGAAELRPHVELAARLCDAEGDAHCREATHEIRSGRVAWADQSQDVARASRPWILKREDTG